VPITPRIFGERGKRRASALGIDPAWLPPGQSPTLKWPVLSVGATPRVDRAQWILSVDGAVQEPYVLGWEQLLAEPQTDWTGDIHCVTRWSKFGMRWRGVAVRTLLKRPAFIAHQKADGIIAINIRGDDELIAVRRTSGHDEKSRVARTDWTRSPSRSGSSVVGTEFGLLDHAVRHRPARRHPRQRLFAHTRSRRPSYRPAVPGGPVTQRTPHAARPLGTAATTTKTVRQNANRRRIGNLSRSDPAHPTSSQPDTRVVCRAPNREALQG
jgi:hypothetical protein